ncbi:hypothetical protein [Cerasicoccus fimbriatus]|uniref:hypothetical protein n=1 Tax=Cerasicoccus fimbriatus TaxID=3014554 RepID=UPI0022B51CBD|nr:hypothetical protein [Cerasicoccus sp. TK19100]
MSHPTRETVFRQISDRLRAYGVDHLSVRYTVTDAILREATQRGEDNLLAHASAVFNEHQAEIVETIRQHAGLPKNAQGRAQAVLILRQANANTIWPAAVESTEALRAEFAIHPLPPAITTGPALSRSTLGAPQINFGSIEETTNSTLAMLNRWPKLRFAGFLGILGGLTAFIVFTAR